MAGPIPLSCAFRFGQIVGLALAWYGYMTSEDEAESESGEFVVCQAVKSRKQDLLLGLLAIRVVAGEVLSYLVDEGIGVKMDEGAQQCPQLGCGEHGWSILKNAVEGGLPALQQFVATGAFGLVFLLLPLVLLPSCGLFAFPFRLLFAMFSSPWFRSVADSNSSASASRSGVTA
jgi:hypothetical protein